MKPIPLNGYAAPKRRKSSFEKAVDFATRGMLAILLFIFVLFIFNLLVGCATPQAGTLCSSAGDAFCVADGGIARSCQGGVLVDYPCHGPKACAVDGARTVFCDQSDRAGGGDPCFPVYEGHGQCSPDGNSLLHCAAGTWIAVACGQGLKCSNDGGVACR